MKHPDKSFTHNGKKYRRVVIGDPSCGGCTFFYEYGCTLVGDKTKACIPHNNSDNEWSIWVEVKKRAKSTPYTDS